MQANVKGDIFLQGSFYSRLLKDFIWNMDSSKGLIWHRKKKSCTTYIADIWVCFICLSYNFMLIWWIFPEIAQWKKPILKPFLFPHKVVLWYWLYSSWFGCSWFISVPPSAQIFVCKEESFSIKIKFHCTMFLRLFFLMWLFQTFFSLKINFIASCDCQKNLHYCCLDFFTFYSIKKSVSDSSNF